MPSSQIPLYRPAGNTIAELLMQQGNIAAQRAARSGEIWGGALAGLGQVAATAIEQHQQQKEEEKRKVMFAEALDSFDPRDPGASYRKIAVAVGPDVANEVLRGFAAIDGIQKKEQIDPKDVDQLIRAAKATKDVVGEEVFARDYYPRLQESVGPRFGGQMPPPEQVGKFLDEWTAPKPTEARFQVVPTAEGFRPFDPSKGTFGDVIGQPAPKETKAASLDQQLADAYSKGDQQAVAGILALKAREAAATRAPQKAEEPHEYTLNPEGVVLSSYGVKQKDEVRKQAMERGLPVFENAATQTKGVILRSIVEDALELRTLLGTEKVKDAIGPFAGRWSQLKAKVVDLDPDVQRAIQLMTSLSDTELRKRSGAQINEQEMKRILRFAADPNRPLGHNVTAVNQMLKSGGRDYKSLAGVDITGTGEDLGGGLSFLGEK